MARLSDVRHRFPPDDAGAYAAAYAEAELAERVGTLVHALRSASGLDAAGLAARIGADDDEIVRAEEGDASVTVGLLDRLARAAGVRLTLSSVALEIVLGEATPAPVPPTTEA
jgi:ribosome-binding protein aMBF1 (putative translation factor)